MDVIVPNVPSIQSLSGWFVFPPKSTTMTRWHTQRQERWILWKVLIVNILQRPYLVPSCYKITGILEGQGWLLDVSCHRLILQLGNVFCNSATHESVMFSQPPSSKILRLVRSLRWTSYVSVMFLQDSMGLKAGRWVDENLLAVWFVLQRCFWSNVPSEQNRDLNLPSTNGASCEFYQDNITPD